MMTTSEHQATTSTETGLRTRGRVSRRALLKGTGLGVGAVTVAGLGVAGARAASNGAFTSGTGDPYELWHTWDSLGGIDRVAAAGVLACNPHNTQAWRISVEGDVVHVWSDPTRRMAANDALAREHVAGLGCAVENMVIAARALGFATTVTGWPEGTAGPAATIGLRSGGAVSDEELASAIPRRHTNRGPYSPGPVDLSALREQGSHLDGASVLWITDPAARSQLGALYVAATQAIVADDLQSREAFSWFRNERADIDRHRDGLTLDGQGLGRLTLVAAKLLPPQSRADGDAFWVEATRDVHTATAAAYGVVVVDDVSDPGAQLTGGRLLARLHLAATAQGLGFHHMNQITERIDRDRALGRPDAFSERWSTLLGRPASTGLLSFRIGHPERTPGLSPRRRLADVISG
jgi:hypothetical protein